MSSKYHDKTIANDPIRNQLSDIAKIEAERARNEAILNMELRQFRKEIAGLTQVVVAKRLGVSQPEVSKLERRGDMLLSTLKAYCGAIGADCQIVLNIDGKKTQHNLLETKNIQSEIFSGD